MSTECPPSQYQAESNLQPNTLLVLRCVHRDFPRITTFYGVRPDQLPDHPSGRAVDVMIPDYQLDPGKQYGDSIVHYLQQNSVRLGIQYVMWQHHIWNVARAAEGWRWVPDRGGATANHMDHIHVTTAGAEGGGGPVTVPPGQGNPPSASLPPAEATPPGDGPPTGEAGPTPDPTETGLTPTPTPEPTSYGTPTTYPRSTRTGGPQGSDPTRVRRVP